ncbi:RrF2 family transcriptional regulator [Planctomycetota bacterium]
MRISPRTRYGIRAMIELAAHYEQGPLQLRIIAERLGISAKHLEQQMAILRSSALVRAVRGVKGGYMLAKPPAEIRLSEVFRCLEGRVVTSACVDDPDVCDRAIDYVIGKVWTEVEEAVINVLDSVTLGDMMDRMQKQ